MNGMLIFVRVLNSELVDAVLIVEAEMKGRGYCRLMDCTCRENSRGSFESGM